MEARLDHVARIAREAPTRIAIDDGATALTFEQLDRRANQFGRALIVKCTPVGAAIGWLAPPSAALVEVGLGATRVDVRLRVVDPAASGADLDAACEGLVGLVVAAEVADRAAGAATGNDHLNFLFVLDGEASATAHHLAGAAAYEPSLAAYPPTPPEPDGPRLHRPVGDAESGPSLTEPPPVLELDSQAPLPPTWLADALDTLGVGGRVVLRGRALRADLPAPDPTEPLWTA